MMALAASRLPVATRTRKVGDMKRITYGTETFVVDDRAGEEVIERAKAVAATRDPEVVEVVILQPDGTTRKAAMLIGPSTPVLAVEAPDLDVRSPHRSSTRIARVSPIDPNAVYDDSSTYFDLGFDS